MSRTNFNHILQFEDELVESISRDKLTMNDSTPIILLEIAKTLNIIADTLENIERRSQLDKDDTGNRV